MIDIETWLREEAKKEPNEPIWMKALNEFRELKKSVTYNNEGIEMPADYSFATVNSYVHAVGRQYEELEALCLGMACEIDRLKARCAHEMESGLALENTMTGVPDFPDGDVVTVSYGGPGKLVECMKCVKCGYTVWT